MQSVLNSSQIAKSNKYDLLKKGVIFVFKYDLCTNAIDNHELIQIQYIPPPQDDY